MIVWSFPITILYIYNPEGIKFHSAYFSLDGIIFSLRKKKQMPRHLISVAHEWIEEILTDGAYYGSASNDRIWQIWQHDFERSDSFNDLIIVFDNSRF